MFKQTLQTGGLLLIMLLAPPAGAQFRPGLPIITSVTPMTASAAQTIIIKGQGFGTHAPYVGQDIPYIAIHDNTNASAAHWEAGHVTPTNWDAITLSVDHWTDTEIQVTGFGGAYGRGTWRLTVGDQIKLEVWNPQTGAGPATYDLTIETQDSKTRNLITNPDFEEQLAHWSVSQGTAVYTADPTVRHAGRFSVKGVESSATSLGRLFQDVTGGLVPGRQYVLSGWIRTESVAGGSGAVIALNYVDKTGWTPMDGFVVEVGNVTGTQDWTFFQSPLVTLPPMPPDAGALCVVLGFNAATGTAWFDDLRLSPVESPLPPAGPGTAQASSTGNTPKVSLGQTVDEVIAILGKPDQIVDLGGRVIYVYKARRIVFTDGRVTDTGVAQPQ